MSGEISDEDEEEDEDSGGGRLGGGRRTAGVIDPSETHFEIGRWWRAATDERFSPLKRVPPWWDANLIGVIL